MEKNLRYPYHLSKELLQKIVLLAFGLKPEHYLEIIIGRNTMYRHMDHCELWFSLMIVQSKLQIINESKETGIHLCVMKNMDLFARTYPYYEGDLSELLMIQNQTEIMSLLIQFNLNQNPFEKFEHAKFLKKSNELVETKQMKSLEKVDFSEMTECAKRTIDEFCKLTDTERENTDPIELFGLNLKALEKNLTPDQKVKILNNFLVSFPITE